MAVAAAAAGHVDRDACLLDSSPIRRVVCWDPGRLGGMSCMAHHTNDLFLATPEYEGAAPCLWHWP
jgi:hypothetical protein